MPLFDWVALAVLLISVGLGLWRGLIYEMLSLAGWVAAFLVAQHWASELAAWMPVAQTNPSVRHAVAFVLLFVGAAFVAGWLAWAARKLVAVVGLRPVDRTLGLVFGLARGLVLLLAVAVVVSLMGLGTQPWWRDSFSAPMLETLLRGMAPVFPDAFARRLSL
jgi:membrane protein required for colicin V production